MNLQHAQCSSFAEHPLPGHGIELGARTREIERVGAIGTAQWAAMCEFCEQSQWGLDVDTFCRRHRRNTFLSTRSCSMATTSPAMNWRGASYRRTVS